MMASVLRMTKTRYALIGVFCVAFAAVSIATSFQNNFVPADIHFIWQCVSGSAVLFALCYQWYLMRKRWIGQMTRNDIVLHRWMGVTAVFLFALHAPRIGHTWMAAITIIFVLIALTGIFNKEVLRFKTRRAYLIWLALHIGLSVAIAPLIAVHIWVALSY